MALLQTLGPSVQTMAAADQYPNPYTVGPFAQPLTEEILPPPPPPPPPPPRGKGGGGWCPVPDPRDEPNYIDPAELARVAFEALADWKCDADAEARNLAATAGLALCGDESEGAALAVMAALLLEEPEKP